MRAFGGHKHRYHKKEIWDLRIRARYTRSRSRFAHFAISGDLEPLETLAPGMK